MAEQNAIHLRLGALGGGLTGLALAAGIWGPDALAMGPAHMPLYYPSVLLAAAGVLLVGVLAGWLAARSINPVLCALTWLAAAVVSMLIAGHLAFEGRTLLAWLADRRFWGLAIYPFDAGAQWRLVVASFFPLLVLTTLGLLQDYRLEGIRSSLNAQRLSGRAWLLLLLPLPVVLAGGLAADVVVNAPLRNPMLDVAQAIRVVSGYTGDLDVLSRQTGINYSAVHSVRDQLSNGYRLTPGEIDLSDEQTVVVVADFDNGAWINCQVLVHQLSFCHDARPAYEQGLQVLLAGQDLSQCADCQLQVSPDWQAWLRDKGRFTGTPQISRVAQRGSYVFMRAANPGSGYAVECLFQGNRTINLVSCKEA
jgi:hypothetical protein